MSDRWVGFSDDARVPGQPLAALSRGRPTPCACGHAFCCQRCHYFNQSPGPSTRATHCRARRVNRPGRNPSFFISVLTRQPWQPAFKSTSFTAAIRL